MNFFYDIKIIDTETDKPVWIRSGAPSQDARLTMIEQMDMDLHTAQEYLSLVDAGKPVVLHHPRRRNVRMTLTAHNAGDVEEAEERKYEITPYFLGKGAGRLEEPADFTLDEAVAFAYGYINLSREAIKEQLRQMTYGESREILDPAGEYELFVVLKRPEEKARFIPESRYAMTVWHTKTHEPYFSGFGPMNEQSLRFNLKEGFDLTDDETQAFMLLLLKGSVQLETRIRDIDLTISARIVSA